MSFTIIIPIYNNRDTLLETIETVTQNVSKFGYPYTIIFIDDGSTDNSSELLREQRKNDSRFKIIRFDKNYGPMTAIYAGLKSSESSYSIIVSADLQEEKDLISRFIESTEKHPSADLIIGVRETNSDYFIFKILSRLFYKLIKLKVPNMPEGGFDTVCIRKDLKQQFIAGYYTTIFGQVVLLELSKNTINVSYHRLKSSTKKLYLKSFLFKVSYFLNGLKFVYFEKHKKKKITPPDYNISEQFL